MASVSPSAAAVKVADFVPEVPDSMEQAFTDWLLATGALLARAGKDQPSAMLIHIHQRTAVQNMLQPEVEEMVRRYRNAWRYDKDGPLRASIAEHWENEFRAVTRRIDAGRDMPFEEIESHIDRVLKDGVPVLALNSRTDHVLDYEQDRNLKAVLIGGNRLSRGMTIEGLTVSYYVRETPYFDTLLQMARWFGYREPYVDLTRIWTTPTLASWFRDLALREEELREQVMQAERDQLSPLEVGYKIRSHPAMMVTAQNKMGAGRQMTLSFAGTMAQTSRFRLDDAGWLTANLDAAKGLLGQLGPPSKDPSGVPCWVDVPSDLVHEFLGKYQSVQSRTSFDSGAVAEYINRQVDYGELTHWAVAVAAQQREVEALGTIDLDIEEWGPVNAIARSRLKLDRNSIGVLTNPARKVGSLRQGEEEIGLSDEQILAARKATADGKYERIRTAILAQRSPADGLLVLYPISRRSKAKAGADDRADLFDNPADGQHVIGVAIGFPPSDSAATIEYITGSVATGYDE